MKHHCYYQPRHHQLSKLLGVQEPLLPAHELIYVVVHTKYNCDGFLMLLRSAGFTKDTHHAIISGLDILLYIDSCTRTHAYDLPYFTGRCHLVVLPPSFFVTTAKRRQKLNCTLE